VAWGLTQKINFFIIWPLIFMVFGFLHNAEFLVKKYYFKARPKLKVVGGCP
jgi:hypothetical protein